MNSVAYVHKSIMCMLKDTEKQLRLSEEVIHNLKQEVSSLKEESNSAVFMLKQRIAVLTAENEQLKSQQRVKEEQGECHKYGKVATSCYMIFVLRSYR